jgi:preprotein translocase subunit SecE
MSKFFNYIQASYDELLHKVTWPTWDELQQLTVTVLVGFLILTVVIFGMDAIGEQVMKVVYDLLGN